MCSLLALRFSCVLIHRIQLWYWWFCLLSVQSAFCWFSFLVSNKLNFIIIAALFQSYWPKHLKCPRIHSGLLILNCCATLLLTHRCLVSSRNDAFSLYCAFNLFIFFPHTFLIIVSSMAKSPALLPVYLSKLLILIVVPTSNLSGEYAIEKPWVTLVSWLAASCGCLSWFLMFG